MADDDLRSLARAVEARPGDVVAGWAYARALGRIGELRGEGREIARLARHGDREAEAALDRLAPWPARTGQGLRGRSGLPGPGPGARFSASVALGPVPSGEQRRLGPAGAEVVLVSDPERMQAFGARDLELYWERPIAGPASYHAAFVAGDLLLIDGSELLLLDASSGEVVSRVGYPAPIAAVAVQHDRALVKLVRGPRDAERALMLVDLGQRFGRPIWSRRLDYLYDFHAAGPWIVLANHEGDRGLEVLRKDDGSSVWARSFPELTGRQRPSPSLVAADPRGLVLQSDADRIPSAIEVVTATGARRWQHDMGGGASALDDDVFLKLQAHDHGRCLGCVDRASAALRWRTELGRVAHVMALTPGFACVVGVERVLAAEEGPVRVVPPRPEDRRELGFQTLYGHEFRRPNPREQPGAVVAVGVELVSGEIAWRVESPGPVGTGRLQVIAHDGALIGLLGDRLFRIAGPG